MKEIRKNNFYFYFYFYFFSYSNNTFEGETKKCEFGQTKKILYIFTPQYSNFTKLTRYSKERPHNENYSKISFFNFNGTLITGYDLPNYLLSEINSSFFLDEDEDDWELKIIFKFKRKIEDISKESLFLNINGNVVDFVNLTEIEDKIINTMFSSTHPLSEYNKTNEINFSLIYKRENLTSENSNENLIEISEISITNTLIGGNYKCVPCRNVRKTL